MAERNHVQLFLELLSPATSKFLAVVIFHSWKKQGEDNLDYTDSSIYRVNIYWEHRAIPCF